MASENELITPCCGTRIYPAAGFQSVECCGKHFSREDLEQQSDE